MMFSSFNLSATARRLTASNASIVACDGCKSLEQREQNNNAGLIDAGGDAGL